MSMRLSIGLPEIWLEILDYSTRQKFLKVIKKAKQTCINSGFDLDDHFNHMVKIVDIGSGAKRKTDDFQLSRYACYLIIQNGDSSKGIIALRTNLFCHSVRKAGAIRQGIRQGF
jgi:DNA-damage-inducible protein D